MMDDKVYSPYVLREHQAERKRAEEADKKVEQLAAKLRELGSDPNL
ncbi:hypothetical protein GMMP15_340005 [Candidatus Magnetomoraceae bacterium gMMP-15]